MTSGPNDALLQVGAILDCARSTTLSLGMVHAWWQLHWWFGNMGDKKSRVLLLLQHRLCMQHKILPARVLLAAEVHSQDAHERLGHLCSMLISAS